MVGVKGSPLWNVVMELSLPPAHQPVETRADPRAETPSPAERKLIHAAQHEALRHVEG